MRLCFLLILLLSGCASPHAYHFDEWGYLNHEASLQPSGSWFDDHDAMRHMQCFPARCQHY